MGKMFAALLLATALPMLCQGALVGGKTEIKINETDPNVMFAVTAINGFYAKQGDNENRDLVKVVKATSQVVAGTLYTLLLDVKSSGGEELCEVTVWSRPWLSGDEAMQVSDGPSCKPADKQQQVLAGGMQAADPDAQEVQDAELCYRRDELAGKFPVSAQTHQYCQGHLPGRIWRSVS